MSLCKINCDLILKTRPYCHISKCSGEGIEKTMTFIKFFLLDTQIGIPLRFLAVKFHIAAFLLREVIKHFPAPCKFISVTMKQNRLQIDQFVFLGSKSSCNGG